MTFVELCSNILPTTKCIFDFETRNKRSACLFPGKLDFFLNVHSEISYPTPFSETVQRDDTNRAISLLFGCQVTLEIRETAAGSYGRKQPANTEETAVFIHCYGTCYHRRFGVLESN